MRSAAGRRYARALFALATEYNSLAEVRSELGQIAEPPPLLGDSTKMHQLRDEIAKEMGFKVVHKPIDWDAIEQEATGLALTATF